VNLLKTKISIKIIIFLDILKKYFENHLSRVLKGNGFKEIKFIANENTLNEYIQFLVGTSHIRTENPMKWMANNYSGSYYIFKNI